ncbi:MAG: aldo/keto reductase family oxidoreductase [Saprospiraceae bacterium]
MSNFVSPERLHLSRIVFGVMNWGIWGHNLSAKAMSKLINESIALGVTSFDHADIYGHYTTEAMFGNAIKGKSSLRNQMEIVTKCGIKLVTPNRPSHKIKSYDTSKAHIIHSVENSLRNFHTDYIDLLLIHRPSPIMDYAEIAEAFWELKQSGKVRFFGVSNFKATQFEVMNEHFPLVTNQVEASLLNPKTFFDRTFDRCMATRAVPMVWSPLGGGKIFTDVENKKVKRIRKTASELGEKYNVGIDQILLAWLMKHPAQIRPVVGTARIERLKSAVEATNINLTHEEWFELLEASRGGEVA